MDKLISDKESRHISLAIITFFGIVPVLSYMILGETFALRASFASQMTFLGYYSLIFGIRKSDFCLISNLLFLLFLSGLSVGLLYTLLGFNNFTNFLEYSTFSLFSWMGLILGIRMSKEFSLKVLYIVIISFCFSELLFLIPRVFILGIFRRTSIATTPWIPVLFSIIFSKTPLSSKFKIFATILITLSIFSALTSGMRSVMLLTLVQLVVIFFVFLLSFKKEIISKMIFSLKILLLPLILILATKGTSIGLVIQKSTNSVISRVETTLLNKKGFKLDNSKPDENRSGEMKKAIKKYKENAGLLNYMLGFGHGFYFIKHNTKKAHIHLTSIAFLVRYGILGISTYLLIVLTVLYYNCRVLFFKVDLQNKILSFSVLLASSYIVVTSLIAGAFVSFTAWIILGLALGIYFKLTKLSSYYFT